MLLLVVVLIVILLLTCVVRLRRLVVVLVPLVLVGSFFEDAECYQIENVPKHIAEELVLFG